MIESEQKNLINKAADFSTCSMEYVGHLRSVMYAIEKLSSNKENINLINDLSSLGSYLATDIHNIFDCEREEFEAIRTQHIGGKP